MSIGLKGVIKPPLRGRVLTLIIGKKTEYLINQDLIKE